MIDKKYRVVRAGGLDELENLVTEYIMCGWEFAGGFCQLNGTWYQPMVWAQLGKSRIPNPPPVASEESPA